jgi:hypothetical protein
MSTAGAPSKDLGGAASRGARLGGKHGAYHSNSFF